jgi:hypothetical protein
VRLLVCYHLLILLRVMLLHARDAHISETLSQWTHLLNGLLFVAWV